MNDVMEIAEEENIEMDESEIVVFVYQDKVTVKEGNFYTIITQNYGFEEINGFDFRL